jgi:uncharacterized protein
MIVRSPFILAMLLSTAAFGQNTGVVGNWLGELHAGPVTLRVALEVSKSAAGKLAGKFDSLDQGATVPVTKIELTGDQVSVTMTIAQFEGKLSADGQTIDGTFHQNGMSLPLVLKRVATIEAPRRPQRPKPPFPYNSEDVTIVNKAGGVTLGGTLTLPRGAGPFPAVVMLTGSGPQDRDETIFDHKPFLVIADRLTRRGIAVLRTDDRGVGKSTGSLATVTDEDLAGDAIACVEFLKSRKDINPDEVGLIGHSEGGIIAPIAAVRSKDVAFIVLLAGPGVRGDALLREQGIQILRAQGAPQSAIDRQVKVQGEMIQIVESDKDPASAAKKMETALGASPQAEAQIRMINSPEMRFMLTYDPAETLKKLTCPVLAMNGTHDRQVWYKQNLPAIGAALAESGSDDYETVALPNLNHLFQTSKTGSITEYAAIEETFAPIALETMSDWLLRHVHVVRP